MGDETHQFATRFSSAVSDLAALAGDDAACADLVRRHGARIVPAVREALDAVGAVYATRTEAVKDWPEQRRRVLARIAAVREALDQHGIDDGVRHLVAALVQIVDPGGDARR